MSPEATTQPTICPHCGQEIQAQRPPVILPRKVREVLALLVEGKSRREICNTLEISLTSFNRRLRWMKEELQLPSKAHVIAWGINNYNV